MRHWDLPPLILYPFGRGLEAASSLDSIRLALYQAGLGEPDPDLEAMLRGRYTEFRMLCLAGKDLMRWIAQCVDFASRDSSLSQPGIRAQSFADLLVNHTPPAVAARFEDWAVQDYRRILARAIGLNAVFPNPPDPGVLAASFLEDYYAYSDALFTCYLGLTPFAVLDPAAFSLALYTSDEYLNTLRCQPEEE